MRTINKLVIHCSDSPYIAHDDIRVIKKWHVEERGWSDVGYHIFIRMNGDIQLGRPFNITGAHAKGHNHDSIGICLAGRDEFSVDQLNSLERLLKDLLFCFNLKANNIYGHYELDSKKTCPNIYMNGLREKLSGIST